MSEQEIIDMATVRLRYLQKEHDLHHGEFDLHCNSHTTAVAIVHDGKIQYITVHDTANHFRKKIKP